MRPSVAILFLVLFCFLVLVQTQTTGESETEKLISQLQQKVAELGQTSTPSSTHDANDPLWKKLKELEDAIAEDNSNVTPVPKIGFQKPVSKTTPRVKLSTDKKANKNNKPVGPKPAPQKPKVKAPANKSAATPKKDAKKPTPSAQQPGVAKKPVAAKKPSAAKKPITKKPTKVVPKPTSKTPITNAKKPVKVATTPKAIKKQEAIKKVFKPLPKITKQVNIKVNTAKTGVKKASANIATILKQAVKAPTKLVPKAPPKPSKLQVATEKRVAAVKHNIKPANTNEDTLQDKQDQIYSLASKVSSDLVKNFDSMEKDLLNGNTLTPGYMTSLSIKLVNQTAGRANFARILKRIQPETDETKFKVRYLMPGGTNFDKNDCTNHRRPCNSFAQVNDAMKTGDTIRILFPFGYSEDDGVAFPDCKQIVITASVKFEVEQNKQIKFVDQCDRAKNQMSSLFLMSNSYIGVQFRNFKFSGFGVPFISSTKLSVFDAIKATRATRTSSKNYSNAVIRLENMQFSAFTSHVIILFGNVVLLEMKNTDFYGTRTAVYGIGVSTSQFVLNRVNFKEITGSALYLVARGISYTYIDNSNFELCGYYKAKVPNVRQAHDAFHAGDGGAIFLDGLDNSTLSILAITNSKFEQNTANNGAAMYLQNAKIVRILRTLINNNAAIRNGGGIFLNAGSLINIEQSFVSDNANRVGSGAGLFLSNVRALNVRNTPFTSNVAYSNAAISATAVRLALITKSKFVSNTARYLGGAVYFFQSEVVVITTTIFHWNKAFADAGGAIKLSSVLAATIQNCDFESNFAVQGGAIALSNVAKIDRTGLSNGAEISRSSFRRNRASQDGGAIFIAKNFLLSIDKTGFSGNSATKSGGAIYSSGTSNKQTKQDDRFTQTSVVAPDYGFTISHSMFFNNSASSGGSIDCKSLDIYLYIAKTVFEKNNATIQGGSIATSCQTYVKDSSMLSSRSGRKGGALAVNLGAVVRAIDVYVSNAQTVDGGAIYVESEGTFITDGFEATSNNAIAGGGALRCNEYSKCYLEQAKLSGNRAAQGGAVYAESRSTLFLTSSNCTANVARFMSYGLGGALFIEDINVALNLTNVNLQHNNATYGGAIAYGTSNRDDANNLVITYSGLKLDHNTAQVAGGTFFFSKGYQADIWNKLLKRNTKFKVSGSKIVSTGYGAIIASQPTVLYVFHYALQGKSYIVVNATKQQSFNVSMYPGQAITISGKVYDFFNQVVAYHPQAIIRLQSQVSSVKLEGSSFDVTINKLRTNFAFSGISVYGNIGTTAELQVSTDNVPTYSIHVTFGNCPAGFKISKKLDADYCEQCPPGSYSLAENSATCIQCPPFVECPGGNIVKSQPNYWYQVMDTTVQVNKSVTNGTNTRMALQTIPTQVVNVHYCPNGKCLGNNQCADNRDPSSPICAVCKPGYSEWNGSCVKCESSNGAFLALFVLYILFTFLFQHISSQSSKSGSSKILFFFGQTLTLIMASNDMSSWAKALFDFELISKTDSDGVSTCPFARDSYGKQLTNMLLPTSFFGLLVCMFLIVLALKFIVDRIRDCIIKATSDDNTPTIEDTKNARALERFEVEKEIARQRELQAKLVEQPETELSENEQTEVEEEEEDQENTDMNVDDDQEDDAGTSSEPAFVQTVERRRRRGQSIRKLGRRFSVIATKAQRSLSNTFLSINSYIISFSNFIIITYQQFTKTGLLYFACTQFGQDYRLIHSTDVVCGSTLYYSWMALYVIAVVYGVVFPIVLLAFLLIANKMQWLDKPKFKKFFGPFYVSYRRSTYWYECFSLARRLVLLGFYVIASTLLQNSPGVQYIGFAAILAFCFVVQRLARPFAMKMQNVFEQCALFVLILVSLLRGSYTYIVQPMAIDILITVLSASMAVVLVLNVIRHNWLVVWIVSVLQHYIIQPYIMPPLNKAKDTVLACFAKLRKSPAQQPADMSAIVAEQQEALLSDVPNTASQ